VYQCARANPTKLYIGVDANARPLEKISEKIHRNPKKGGAPNALFVRAAVENLPDELSGIAQEVCVNFPWSSLLGGVVRGHATVLGNLRRICAAGASLKIVLGLDAIRDHAELERLALPHFSIEYVDEVLALLYLHAGFELRNRRELRPAEVAQLKTAWARRLSGSPTRRVFELIARARCQTPML
jgi:16S rRNA (adenine(1408)-N(1))-methyltransferase